MVEVRATAELKRDLLGRVELLAAGDERRVRRVSSGSRLPWSRLVARLLAARERRALARLDGAGGAPRLELGEQWTRAPGRDGAIPDARDVLVREWIDGAPLSSAEALPENFFELLDGVVRELHARGVCHNDLHKEGNIVVRTDGRPALVDFQLASLRRAGWWPWRTHVREDLRHVQKHRRRYLGSGRGPAGASLAGAGPRQRRSFVAWAWRRAVKPVYEFLTRRVLHWRDTAERRPSTGPWPRWTPQV